jgi:hypothetical protein
MNYPLTLPIAWTASFDNFFSLAPMPARRELCSPRINQRQRRLARRRRHAAGCKDAFSK